MSDLLLDAAGQGTATGARAGQSFPQGDGQPIVEPRSGKAQKMLRLAVRHHRTGRLGDAINQYRLVLELAPRSNEARIGLGQALAATGQLDAASLEFESIIERQPDHAGARRNLNEIYAHLIPNWHFLMIADAARNDAYERAIRKAVRPDDLVFEIGTGSGLLSMMAARAGARQVVTCEVIGPLARAAGRIVARNGFADRITVLNKMSTELTVGVDLPRRADVLVFEIFDAGLLGEGVSKSLRHALQDLMVPGARTVPYGATIKGFLIECPRHRRVNPIRTISGFDLSEFSTMGISNMVAVSLGNEDHVALSDIFDVFSFNFTAPIPEARSEKRTARVVRAGTCHGVCYWFDLDLDKGITLDGAPGNSGDHWQQVIHFFDEDVLVEPGMEIDLIVQHNTKIVRFDFDGVKSGGDHNAGPKS